MIYKVNKWDLYNGGLGLCIGGNWKTFLQSKILLMYVEYKGSQNVLDMNFCIGVALSLKEVGHDLK